MSVLLQGEDEQHFRLHLLSIQKEIKPRGSLECFLVMEVAILTWDILRFLKYKAHLITQNGVNWQLSIQERMKRAELSGPIEKRFEPYKSEFPDLSSSDKEFFFGAGVIANLEAVKQLDFITGQLEARRNATLREIDRRRAAALRLEFRLGE